MRSVHRVSGTLYAGHTRHSEIYKHVCLAQFTGEMINVGKPEVEAISPEE